MPGLYYEDFEIGKTYRHAESRSVTSFDNIWHSMMTLNTQPLHSNFDWSFKNGMYKKNLFNSMYTISIVMGQSVSDLTRGTLMEVVSMTDIDFPAPVFHDDTLYSRTTILAKEDAADGGVVELLHEGYNQDDKLIATCKRKVKVRRRPAAAKA